MTASFTATRQVALVGGGNTAVEEALFLTNFASQGDPDPPARRAARREDPAGPAVRAIDKIEVLWDHVVEEVRGDDEPLGVTGVVVKHVATGALSELAVDGLFIAIGHDPATQLFRGQARDGLRGLHPHPARFDRDRGARRLCRRRRPRQGLSPGRDGGWAWAAWRRLEAEKYLAEHGSPIAVASRSSRQDARREIPYSSPVARLGQVALASKRNFMTIAV